MGWIDTTASVATAIGVMAAFGAIWQQQRTSQRIFEIQFTDRYNRIAARLPIGPRQIDEEGLEVAVFDYLELCEEQLYYRETRRITRSTWMDWWIGIRCNLRDDDLSPTITSILSDATYAQRFGLLKSAERTGFPASFDPLRSWWRQHIRRHRPVSTRQRIDTGS